MTPDIAAKEAIAQAFETTWPAAEYRDTGGFRIGRGLGGGDRISSARALKGWSVPGISKVAEVHRDWDQHVLFRVDDSDARLTAALADAGYRRRSDSILVMEAPTAALSDRDLPPVTAFPSWPPLAIQREIWAAGQITPVELAAMERVTLPRITILGRIENRPAGTLYMGTDGEVAMIHALEILPTMRRQGMGSWLIRAAAIQAGRAGASRLALAVVNNNHPAIALYRKLGFTDTIRYDYWE